MTNADKIRAMNDVELAAWIDKTLEEGRERFCVWLCDRCLEENSGRCPMPDEEPCDKVDDVLLLWLREPAEN